MSGDCQSQGLANWLQKLGYPNDLQPSDLQKLNTPKMRSIWRHLQHHVVPSNTASIIRKNVLLTRLENDKICGGQFGNFKVDSVGQLEKVKEIRKIEDKKDEIKSKIKMVDKKLQSEMSNLLQKVAKVEWENHKLSEMKSKTTILELKQVKLLKDCSKINNDKETAVHLKIPRISVSHSELNYQTSLVSKYIKNYRYPFQETDDDSEYLCEMMSSILEFKSDSVLSGITRNAKEALRSLYKVDISVNIGDKVTSNKMLTFREKLRDLKVLVIRYELKIHECNEKISSESAELKKEKDELVEAVKIIDEKYSNFVKTSSESKTSMNGSSEHRKTLKEVDGSNNHQESVDSLLEHILESVGEQKKKHQLQKERSRLLSDDECSETLEDLKLLVSDLTEKENELWKEVEKKVSEVNLVTSALFSSFVNSGELNKFLTEISQLASDFEKESNQNRKIIYSSEFTDMIVKEIEMFQKTPLVALQRKWDRSNDMLRVCLPEKFSNDSSLLHYLLQSEPKNLIVNVVGKYFWSLYTNPQFH